MIPIPYQLCPLDPSPLTPFLNKPTNGAFFSCFFLGTRPPTWYLSNTKKSTNPNAISIQQQQQTYIGIWAPILWKKQKRNLGKAHGKWREGKARDRAGQNKNVVSFLLLAVLVLLFPALYFSHCTRIIYFAIELNRSQKNPKLTIGNSFFFASFTVF